jgi:uncharacterized RDD family membrane protein YckC
MSEDISDPGHGHSPAAWTAVIIMLIAFAIGTVGFWLDVPMIVWGAGGLVVVGAIVGWAMTRAGYGVGGSRSAPGDH